MKILSTECSGSPSSTGAPSRGVCYEAYVLVAVSSSSGSQVSQLVNIVKLLDPVSAPDGNRNHHNTGDPLEHAGDSIRKVASSRFGVPSGALDNAAS
jgi:hypothetical protein